MDIGPLQPGGDAGTGIFEAKMMLIIAVDIEKQKLLTREEDQRRRQRDSSSPADSQPLTASEEQYKSAKDSNWYAELHLVWFLA